MNFGSALPLPGMRPIQSHISGVVRNMEDLQKYPWAEIPENYRVLMEKYYPALREALPEGMKVVGGIGGGMFETAQMLLEYEGLCYARVDDPEFYSSLFRKIREARSTCLNILFQKYGDIFAVCHTGDDLGFKTSTLISREDIIEHVIPGYQDTSVIAHAYGKPFLLHSCGNLFNVMEDLIGSGSFDAKHSNEDEIAPFSRWVDLYGDRIGLFGGPDTGFLASASKEEIRECTLDILRYMEGRNGFAISSGNTIPDYVPAENYVSFVETVREYRGE
jgi:uroporphyrinogen decarboxylase